MKKFNLQILEFSFLLSMFVYTSSSLVSGLKLIFLILFSSLYFFYNPIKIDLKDNINKIFIFFISYLLIHSYFSSYNLLNLIGNNSRYFGILFLLFLFFLFNSFRSLSQFKIRKFILYNLILSIIVTFLAFIQKTFKIGFKFLENYNFFDGLPYATFEIPNFMGQYLILTIGLLFFANCKKITNIKYLSIIPIIGVLLSGSKASILSLIMIFIFLNFKSIKKHWALFSVSTGSLIFLFKNPILESLSTRFPIFDISFQMILDYPFGVNLLGLNILTSNYISKINYNSEQSLNVFYDFSHNLVLDVLVWAGIIGFLFLIALSYRMIKNFLQDKHLILLFLTFIPIVSLSILSSVEWVVLTFYFALIFPDSKNKLKTISIDFRLISFFLLIFFVLISRSVIGDSYYSKFQLSNNKIYLEQSLKHNPTNLNATMQTMNFLNKPDLNKFYQIAQNVHGKNNLALYRSYLKALAFNGENIENEAIKLTEINSHDYKNWLLINNFYKLTNQKEKEEQSIPKLTSNLPEINIDIINNSPDIYWNLKKYLE